MPLKRFTPRRWRRFRSAVLWSVAGIVSFTFYLMFLDYKEQQIEGYYSHLKTEKPNIYLSEITKIKGFSVYVKEFERMNGYDKPQNNAPPFLVGRWQLFQKEKLVNEQYFPDACIAGLQIEDGRIKTFGLNPAVPIQGVHPARYRMDGMNVDILVANGLDVRVKIVSYGSHLHHLKVTLPGAETPSYGYLCK